jgi:hypothetical protein
MLVAPRLMQEWLVASYAEPRKGDQNPLAGTPYFSFSSELARESDETDNTIAGSNGVLLRT